MQDAEGGAAGAGGGGVAGGEPGFAAFGGGDLGCVLEGFWFWC